MKVKKLQYALVIVLIVFLSIGYFSYPLLGPDSGFYLATARELYSGKVYFVDIAIAYNPIAIVILGLPFLFSDSPDPRLSLVINMLVIWASSYVLYTILQKINSNRSSNLFYSLFFVLGCLLLDGSHLMLEPISVFFQLIGLHFYLNTKNSEKNNYLIFAGIAFALSFLSKQYGLFILAPIGIDILLNKKSILKKIMLIGLGFLIPIALFYSYLANNGVGFSDFIKHILGIGTQIEIGNGTGINYNLITYCFGFALFIIYNLYVLLIPSLLFKIRKQLDVKNALFLTILPFSLLVLVSASYAHYFLYVLPYALIAFVFLMHQTNTTHPFKKITFLLSLFFMICVCAISYTGKQEKIDVQKSTYERLAAAIPKKSKVYLDGISPAFYYLCDFQSIQLNKFGFTFPGYFYQKTIVDAMETNSYLVVSEGAFPSYRSLVEGYNIKRIIINRELFYIIKKE